MIQAMYIYDNGTDVFSASYIDVIDADPDKRSLSLASVEESCLTADDPSQGKLKHPISPASECY